MLGAPSTLFDARVRCSQKAHARVLASTGFQLRGVFAICPVEPVFWRRLARRVLQEMNTDVSCSSCRIMASNLHGVTTTPFDARDCCSEKTYVYILRPREKGFQLQAVFVISHGLLFATSYRVGSQPCSVQRPSIF